jgi:hypothetical protein
VPVERDAGPVVTHRGPRIGVAGGFLDIAEGDAGIKGGGDERMTQRVWSDPLVDPARRAIRRTTLAAP